MSAEAETPNGPMVEIVDKASEGMDFKGIFQLTAGLIGKMRWQLSDNNSHAAVGFELNLRRLYVDLIEAAEKFDKDNAAIRNGEVMENPDVEDDEHGLYPMMRFMRHLCENMDPIMMFNLSCALMIKAAHDISPEIATPKSEKLKSEVERLHQELGDAWDQFIEGSEQIH